MLGTPVTVSTPKRKRTNTSSKSTRWPRRSFQANRRRSPVTTTKTTAGSRASRARKVKCVGFGQGVSIENCQEDVCAFHDVLMEVDVVFLEVLCNLEQLSTDVFFLSYAPLPIKGLDSCPVRVYAIEGLAEFCCPLQTALAVGLFRRQGRFL